MQAEKDRKRAFLALLEASPRQTPPCPHVADGCGGCLLQEYAYEAQVVAKEQFLSTTYGRPVKVLASPKPFGYRSRMDYVTAFGKTGLRKRGKFAQVVDVKDCLLLPDHARKAYAQAREFLMASDLAQYNYVRHEGFLRYLVVRTGSTGQVMLIITTKQPKDDEQITHVKDLLCSMEQLTGATSVHWTINDGIGDMSVGKEFWHTGERCIIDELAQTQFFVSPNTFFQGNPAMAGVLFDRAMRYVRGDVLDLYSGVGVLALLAAQEEDVGNVIGVELNSQSIAAAKENMVINEITAEKCSFVCDDALQYYAREDTHFDTVICDPARPGLGRELCAVLLGKLPARIIYISCNPLSHVEDLALLSRAYDVVELEGYDLFPQTSHVEVLSILERKDTRK